MPARAKQLPALTSLRFLAALMVFVDHIVRPGMLSYWQTTALGLGGVSFFFVLSGLVLAHAYSARLAAADATAVADFYGGRLARLFPLQLLLLAAMLLVVGLQERELGLAVVLATQMTLTQAWVPLVTVYFALNAPAWSLSVEAFFCLVFPLVLSPILRLRRDLAWLGALAMVAAMFAWGLALGERWWPVAVLPLARLPDFLLGIFLYRALDGVRLAGRPALGLEIVALLALPAAALLAEFAPVGTRMAALSAAPAALMVGVFAISQGPLARALAQAVPVYLGRISFAFYMVHLPLWVVLQPLPWPLLLLATLAAAALLHHLVERPAERTLRPLLARPIRALLRRLGWRAVGGP